MREQRPALGCLIALVIGPMTVFSMGLTLGAMGALCWQGLSLGWGWVCRLFG